MIKYEIDYNNERYELTWIETNDFSKIKAEQVYGVCFKEDGTILIINVNNKWTLPGGKPEKNETITKTLRREVIEEGDVELDKIKPLGYVKVIKINRNKRESPIYQLRFAATISKINKQTIDPAYNKIPERKFINPDEFLDYVPWGEIGKEIVDKALSWYKTAKYL